MSVAYPDLLSPSTKDEVIELSACPAPEKISGRPVLNEFGSGFALKHDVTAGGLREPKIVWVRRANER